MFQDLLLQLSPTWAKSMAGRRMTARDVPTSLWEPAEGPRGSRAQVLRLELKTRCLPGRKRPSQESGPCMAGGPWNLPDAMQRHHARRARWHQRVGGIKLVLS